jgi:hypothetical protein
LYGEGKRLVEIEEDPLSDVADARSDVFLVVGVALELDIKLVQVQVAEMQVFQTHESEHVRVDIELPSFEQFLLLLILDPL